MTEEVKKAAPAATTDQAPAGRPPERKHVDRSRPQGDRGQRPQRPPQRGGGRFQRRRKFCKFCADTSINIDHKDPDLLRGFITERYKILPSRVTGVCSKHQRFLTTAIKRSRVLALVPFTPLHHD